jgi:uncharacterized membrane protein
LAEVRIKTINSYLPARVRRWLPVAALILAPVVIGVFLFTPPWSTLVKARLIGYAVCHQLPNRSFHVAGEQLPLCARCSGTFGGAILGFALMTAWGRRRAAGLPPVRVAVVMICFIAALAVDGINSYLTFFPGLPHLYEPHNWLRLTTGLLNGLALSAIVYPVLNYSLWADAVSAPSVRNFKELALMIAVGVLLGVVILSEPPALLYPLAILGALGVLSLLTALNTTLLLMLLNQEAKATTWCQAALPLVVGLAISFVEIGTIDIARYFVTRGAGFPLLGS